MHIYRNTRAAMATAFLLAPLVTGAMSIDEFTTSQAELNVAPIGPNSDSSWVQTVGTDIIGQERDMLLTVPAGVSTLSADAIVENDAFSFANNGSSTATIGFQWDGNDNDPALLDPLGLGGIDLTEGNTIDAFEIQFELGDLPSVLTLTVHTDGSNSSSVSFPHPGLQLTGDLTLFVPFAAFSSGSADFTNVGAIEMSISGVTTALDLRIDYIRTTVAPVPLPTAVLLLAPALLGMGFMRRR